VNSLVFGLFLAFVIQELLKGGEKQVVNFANEDNCFNFASPFL